jgi:hypothetical protein
LSHHERTVKHLPFPTIFLLVSKGFQCVFEKSAFFKFCELGFWSWPVMAMRPTLNR